MRALSRFVAIGVALAGVGAQSLYDYGGEASALVELTDANFEAEVTLDTAHVWVVEFYADWCGHCKQFAKGYVKAAENLKGLVKFGAVNAENNKAVAAMYGVQGYPTVRIFPPHVERNPYTGKKIKMAGDYQGPRSARGVVDAATRAIPSHVVTLADKSEEWPA